MAFTFKPIISACICLVVLAACATNSSGMTAVSGADKITAGLEGQMAPDGTIVKCRSMQVTGSRFPVKDCKSEKAWDEFDKLMAENAKSATDKFQRVNSGCSVSGSC